MTVGFGEAGGVPPSYAIITDKFPPGRRGTALGIYNLGPPIGAALGIAFGASIAAAFDWRDAFIAIGVDRHRHRAGVCVWSSASRRAARLDARRVAARRSKAPASGATLRVFFSQSGARCSRRSAAARRSSSLMAWATSPTLFLMREKGMTLREVAIWYALVVGVGMGAGMIVSGRADRPADAAIARPPTPSLPGDLAGARAAVLRRASSGRRPGSSRWSSSPCADVPQLFLSLVRRSRWCRRKCGRTSACMSGALLLLVMNFIGLGLGPT